MLTLNSKMDIKKINEKLKAFVCKFREWQQRPYQVKGLSEEEHVCATCNTQYKGNFCPCCGQSAKVGRYSVKNTFLLFLEVWGLGNRSMFRTLRDLILRPGYMIRDYLGGMQMAYFPPFKLFFLSFMLSVLVSTGFNIKGENNLQQTVSSFQKDMWEDEDDEAPTKVEDPEQEAKLKELLIKYIKPSLDKTILWVYNHPNFATLLWLLIFSTPLYLLFRHCPNKPDLRFSEFFVTMVYTTTVMNLIETVDEFFRLESTTLSLCSYAYSLIPLKQFSGYSLKRTLFNLVLSLMIIGVTAIALLILVIVGFYHYFS